MISGVGGCACINGYYKGAYDNCLKCHSDCVTCSNYKTCKKCVAFYSNSLNNLGCKCNDGFYQVAEISNPYACSPCPKNCLKCNSRLVCLTCYDNYYLYKNYCVKCEENCLKCSSDTTCLICKDNYHLFKGNCLKCEENCLECISNSACIICKDNYKLIQNIDCVCDQGYFKEKEMNFYVVCSPCSKYCKECISKYECKICTALNSSFIQNKGCTCDKGFFKIKEMDNYDACIPCMVNCIRCISNATCLICKDNYYLYKEDCLMCHKNCKTCSSYETCLECTALNSIYIQNTGCVCNLGYFKTKDMNYDDACSPCSSFCKKCITNNECILCMALNSKYIQNIGCVCDKGYFKKKEMINIDACTPCSSDCIECLPDAGCISCKDNFYLNNKDCIKCNKGCINCLSETSCLNCEDNYYLDKSNCFKCQKNCKICSSFETCSECIALNSTYIQNIGCKCDKEFFQNKDMNFYDACSPCSNICKECITKSECIICTAQNSKYFQNIGCVCDQGYFKAKEMNYYDACSPCNNICKECNSYTDCLSCADDYYQYKNDCVQCGTLIPSTIARAIFLDSFTDVLISFYDFVPFLSCKFFFGYNNSEKFGENYFCETISKNEIYIKLGTGSLLVNETVEIFNIFLNETNEKCRIKIKFDYLSPLPSPNAYILAPDKFLINSGSLQIDGKLSSGGYNAPLKFEWIISSDSSNITEYSNTTNNSILIPGTILNKGVIKVKLIVTNKFGVKNSINKQILCETSILIIDFLTLSNYSCRVSQKCEYFINKIRPFTPNEAFNFSWEVSLGKNLQLKKIQVLNESSLVIEPNSFKQGTIGFTVNVFNTLGVFGSGNIFIKIIYENPVIELSRSSGSISSYADFYCDASQSMDPNFNCRGDKNCLKFNWLCFNSKNECEFKYDRYNEYLLIPNFIVGKKEFNSLELLVTSENNFKSNFFMKIEIINFKNVTTVLLREYFSKKTPSRISLIENFVVEAVFLDSEADQYIKKWILNNDDDNILSENAIVSVSKDYMKSGQEYELKFCLIVNNVTLNYYYYFTLNNPPIPGKLFVEPKSGYALINKFTFIALYWKDLELDYPLQYAFGFFSNVSKINLIPKQPNQIFSTFLTYIGDPMNIYVKVYDSIGDFVELSQEVSIENSNSTTELLASMKNELSTEMPHNFLSIIYGIVTRILNKEFYTYGKFSNSGLSEILDLQEAFDLCIQFLNEYIDKSQGSKDLIISISELLEELTLNPNLKSSKNAELLLETIKNLIDKCKNIGLTSDWINSLYRSIEKYFIFSSELISENIKNLSTLTTVYEKLNKARAKNLYDNYFELIESKSTKTQLICLEFYKLDSFNYSLYEASVGFPSNIRESYLNSTRKVVLSLTYITLEKSENFTQNIMMITIFDLESTDQISIESSEEISIEIPFDQNNHIGQNYTCLFFNYSLDQWDKNGCFVSNYTKNSIICKCKHLSTFTAGVFNPYSENNIENNETASNKKKEDFDYLSSDGIAIYICIPLFLIYCVFAIICYLKDKKEFIINYQCALDRDAQLNIVENNKIKPNSNVPVDYDEIENYEIEEYFRKSRFEMNLLSEEDDSIILFEKDEERQKIKEIKDVEHKISFRKKFKNNDEDIFNSYGKMSIYNKNNIFINSNVPIDCDEMINYKNIDIIQVKEFERNQEDIDESLKNLRCSSDSPINNSSKNETKLKALKEGLKEFSIYFYTDPNHCRLFRCTSVFFKLFGIIFFIAGFYYRIKLNLSSINFMSVSIFSCIFIFNTLQLIPHFVFREVDLRSRDVFKDNIGEIKKKNSLKVLIAVSFYTAFIIFFVLGTILLAQNLDSQLNRQMVVAIAFGITLELIIIPFAKILFKVFLWPCFAKKNKKVQHSI